MKSDNKLLIYRTFPHLPYVESKTYRKVLYGGIVWVMNRITIMEGNNYSCYLDGGKCYTYM